VRDIAQRAYLYAYPLVLIEATRGGMPVNRFTHVPRFPRPGDGPFDLTFRLYWPEEAILSGNRHPPALERLP
jgi:hypothetical protein